MTFKGRAKYYHFVDNLFDKSLFFFLGICVWYQHILYDQMPLMLEFTTGQHIVDLSESTNVTGTGDGLLPSLAVGKGWGRE